MTDIGSGLPLWTTDRILNHPVFSADGTRLFVSTFDPAGLGPARIEALDALTGATLYAVDLPPNTTLDGLALTADDRLAGVIHPVDSSCTSFGDCPPGYAFWSPADLALLEERPGLPHTDDYYVRSAVYAGFDCSRWSSLCALSIFDANQPESHLVSVVGTNGPPAQLLTVQNVVAFSGVSRPMVSSSQRGP